MPNQNQSDEELKRLLALQQGILANSIGGNAAGPPPGGLGDVPVQGSQVPIQGSPVSMAMSMAGPGMPVSLFGGDDPSMDMWRRRMGYMGPGAFDGSDNGSPGNGVGDTGVGNSASAVGGPAGSASGNAFARGGRVRPRHAANQLAGMGRRGDSMLMHINPRELPGLAALSPNGRLTTNPRTGMPEAFNLLGTLGGLVGGTLGSFILPGIGTGIGAGLGNLAGQGISGKGINFGEGLLSGLLSFGLGSAVSGLAGAAGGALGEVGGAGAQTAMSEAAAQAASYPAMEAVGSGVSSVATPTSALTAGVASAPEWSTPALTGGLSDWGSSAATSGLNVPAAITPTNTIPTGFQGALQGQMDMYGRAAQNATNPDALWNTFGKGFMKTTLPIAAGAYGFATGMGDEGSGAQTQPPQQPQHQGARGYRQMQFNGPLQSTNNWNVDPRGREHNYYTQNPPWQFMKDGGKVKKPDEGSRMTLKEAERMAKEWDKRSSFGYERGMILNNPYSREPNPEVRFNGGGPISGPGGGLDDAIPAVIDGQHPARLSSGEWVAPAHLVSALGNGSTEDGVRQLEGMADRVMKRKYGTSNRQPRPIDAVRFLPG